MEIGDYYTLRSFSELLLSSEKLTLSRKSIDRIESCNGYLREKIKSSKNPIYGVNTGFGSLCNKRIEPNQLIELQKNLLLSHACGTGDEVPSEIVRIMLLLKVLSLSKGHSGVQLSTVQRLLEMYNESILPQVFQQGSLGASGDLAPLAHLALPLINEGMVNVNGELIESKSVFNAPIELQAKEGLALINGTQFMLAYAVYLAKKGQELAKLADQIGSLSLEAFDGRISPFIELSHKIRPHKGQQKSAQRIHGFISGSEIQTQSKEHVQDPYSFRCMPQVHGASSDVIAHASEVFETEMNSVTDNPNVFPEEDAILSAGNFHGQPLAMQLDFLAIAFSELGSISERRIFQLISGLRGLPAFLSEDPGLNSGLMIPQYTAASIASQNKQLSTPASIDSIVSSNGQEDHVSMGANAATKAYRVLENLEQILGIELLVAAQGLDFRRPLRTTDTLESFHKLFREKVPYQRKDVQWSIHMKVAKDFVKAQC